MSWRGFFLSAVLLAALSAPPAEARDRRKDRDGVEPHGLSDRRGEDDRVSPAAVAAEMAVRANGGGRVLSVDRADGGYRVKVLKEGEVRTHHITLE